MRSGDIKRCTSYGTWSSMSITTVLPSDEAQWRTPVIFGSAASLSGATAVSTPESDSSFTELIKLSAATGIRASARGGAGAVTDCGGFAAFADAVLAAAIFMAAFPWACIPHHAPAENSAATATRPITTFNPGCKPRGRFRAQESRDNG